MAASKPPTLSLDQRFADAMGTLLGPNFPSDIALAVSGGGDSMAMLTLAHNWSHRWGVRLWIVTIDHGLRAESAQEAGLVAQEAHALGLAHATLRWHWDGQGNKMDAARRARLDLINRWRGLLGHVLMAHTQDDVAETLLMRLARGSGVDGLSAMTPARVIRAQGLVSPISPDDISGDLPPQFERRKGMLMRPGTYQVIRPCLEMTRKELRHYLRTLKGRWVEDPSNDDPTYARTRIRQVIAQTGLDMTMLADTAHRMARARTALRARAVQVWEDISPNHHDTLRRTGDLVWDRSGFEQIERDTQLRILAAALQFVATAQYRPRAAPLEALLDRLLAGGRGTLHGCEAFCEQDSYRITREFNAVAKLEKPLTDPFDYHDTLWDGRWHVNTNGVKEGTVRALGQDGWAQIKDPPDDAPSHATARALPSIWRGDTLVACDAMGIGNGRTTRLWPMGQEMLSFKAFLLSH